jgi:osmotically-inducible protein OsmY
MKRFVWAVMIMAVVIGAVAPVAAQDRSMGDRVDDALITSTLKAKLVADSPKSLVNVNVDTKDGVVHLQGSVPTEQDRVDAERMARATKGVRDVHNELTVASGAASPRTTR